MNLQKIKLLVRDQFPEFYREEYPQLVDFITQYYAYLDTTQYSALKNIRDVDSSLDRFVYNLKQDFAVNIPQFSKLNDRDFLKFAREFYSSRGSEDSYRFLFRAMYGKEIDIFYPSTLILRASDGTWEQEVSIRVQSTEDLLQLTGNSFNVVDVAGVARAVQCVKVVRVASNLYDVYIDRFYKGPISSGDTISYGTVQGIVQSVPAKIEIISGGGGFVTGAVYSTTGVKPLRFKISAVGVGGAVLAAQILQPGDAGITEDVYAAIGAGTRVVKDTNAELNPAQDYVDTTYFLETGSSQYVVGSAFSAELGDAIIKFVVAAQIRYPGFYSSSRGFLSDAVKIQDNDYYQAYSYVLRLDEQLESYKSVVKRLLHPSGMALWAQYDVSAEMDSTATLQGIFESLKVGVEDDVFTSATSTFALQKNLSSDQTVTDFSRIAMLKALEHAAEAVDTLAYSVTKPQESAISALDSGKIVRLDYSEYAFDYFSEDYIDTTSPTEVDLVSW